MQFLIALRSAKVKYPQRSQVKLPHNYSALSPEGSNFGTPLQKVSFSSDV